MAVKEVWKREWGSSVWTVGGVEQEGISPIGASSGDVTESVTIVANCDGTIIRSMKWISPYPAPEQVLVKVAGWAIHARSEGSQVVSSTRNFVGSPQADAEWGPLYIGKESREDAAYISLSLDESGVATIEAHQTAYVSVTGFGLDAFADARTFSVTLAEYATGVYHWLPATYRKDDVTGLPVLNWTEFITPVFMDTAVEYHNLAGNPHWDLEAAFTKIAYGNWIDPFHRWWANDDYWEDDLFHEYTGIETEYTYDLSYNFPTLETITLSMTNGVSPAVVRVGNLFMRVHKPAEQIIQLSDEREYGDWHKVTPEYTLVPNTTASDTVQATYSESVTSSFSTSVSYSAGIQQAFSQQLSASVTSSLDQTAEIAISRSVTFTFGPPPVTTTYWVERAAFWQKQEGVFDYYAANGFQSVEPYVVKYFTSGSVSGAEFNDFNPRTMSREGF